VKKKQLDRIVRVSDRLNIFKRLSVFFYPKYPVFVFHHIPKCGGTSLSKLLNKWFIVVRDYRKDWNSNHHKKKNIKKLRSIHCLAGHWELPEVYLRNRYPEVFENNRFKVFTFLRDPLEHSLSLYRYEKENEKTDIDDLLEHFTLRPNYISNLLKANTGNYKEIIDSYDFVGIVEEMDKSVKILSEITGMKYEPLPWINKTIKDNKTSSEKISNALIKKFKDVNELDYLIYNYAIGKLNNYQ